MPRKRHDPAKKLNHRSVCYNRTTVDDVRGRLEKVAADHWEMINSLEPEVAQGQILKRIMNPVVLGDDMLGKPVNEHGIIITQDHATAAATVFQWLYTNVGTFEFLEVYKKAGWRVTIEPPKREGFVPFVVGTNNPHPEKG